ncbi:MAG: hypothetical protein QG632_31 [Candidatus Dependentiae bacterium]|nr:hypothetical protein [Candidatus Dependentiae bacterium]
MQEQHAFETKYTITPDILRNLGRIEACKGRAEHASVSVAILSSLRKSARLRSTHYSTFIEGNRLSVEQIGAVLEYPGHFPGREREEDEVKGYYTALTKVEQRATKGSQVSEKLIQEIHSLVMGGGKKTSVKAATPYRDGQNVIYDGKSGAIVYLPPEAHDVPALMANLVKWINTSTEIPCPIVAALAHYQFATIHPYYDGNGRTGRLLATFIIHANKYDLKGIYCLEEYYARNLSTYYDALTVGPSHNYYMGRAEADLTPWIAYFVAGMAEAFENVVNTLFMPPHRSPLSGTAQTLRLTPEQRVVLELFVDQPTISSAQVSRIFAFSSQSAALLCIKLVREGFLEFADSSKKARRYRLAKKYERLIFPEALSPHQ